MDAESTTIGRFATDLIPELHTPLVSDELFAVLWYSMFVCTSAVLSSIGAVGNFLTIFTFLKMGFEDTINISLFNFVLWDFLRALGMVSFRIGGIIHYFDPALEITWWVIGFQCLGILYGVFGYISGTLAGYISLERCLCVSLPFTVKYLVTPRFVITVNVVITVAVLISFLPYYGNLRIYFATHPLLNETTAFYEIKEYNSAYDQLMNVMGILWLGLAFSIICVCTIIISYHLRKFSKFRSQANVTKDKNNVSKNMKIRDQKIMKMLLVIIAVYLITTIPRVLMWFIREVFPEADDGQPEQNLFYTIVCFVGIFDALNIVANPFIFFFMSAQFKKQFISIFKPKCL